MTTFRGRFLLLVLLLLFLAGLAWYWNRRPTFDVEAHYTKREFRIAMRDGVKLFTQVYIPKDTSRPYPFLMLRTPFGVTPYGERHFRSLLGPSASFDRAGYIFVFQDVRGRYESEGSFVDMRPHIDDPAPRQTDESTDTRDSIDWLLQNVPGNNGKVGIWGMSYPGFYAAASIVNSHPAIQAASPQAPVTDLFRGDDAYHNGVFMLAQQFLLYSNYFFPHVGPDMPPANLGRVFDYGTTDGYSFFLKRGPALSNFQALIHNPIFDQNVEHDTYDDYWRARDNSRYLKNIHCPVLMAGGWFDAEDLAGTLRTYDAIRQQNPTIPVTLVMGPWAHGEWIRGTGKALGPMRFDASTSAYFEDQIALPFFEHYLKSGPPPELPPALVFQTGANRWIRENSWPPANAVGKTLYLHANGKLSSDPPTPGERPYDEYVSDPQSPVPYLEHPPTDLASEFMYADQRFLSARHDVLTYLSDPLQQDLAMAGPVSPHLQVSTSTTDSDFDVKLIDVYPDGANSPGYQLLVRGEPMRAKFRQAFSQPEAMIPGRITPIDFQMPDVAHTFERGHRIMVQIQSSWFPLTDLNPQTFVDAAKATPADFVKSTERVYHQPQAASQIQIFVRR